MILLSDGKYRNNKDGRNESTGMDQIVHREAESPSLHSDSLNDQAAIRERRQVLHQRLLQGGTGAEVVESFADFIDAILIARYRTVARKADPKGAAGMQRCCLVAVGGYGRRELAPHSDIDVMILHQVSGSDVVAFLSKELFHHLWDLGFQVGHSVRSITECINVAETDLPARTSLMESRFLAGNTQIFHDFHRRFARRILGRRADQFIQQKLEERHREYAKFGETVYLLEPNIKKSKGGLRDLHLLQWVGMAKYQATTIQELANRGLLAHQDYLALLEAREFLWRVRSFMHFEAGRAQEILSFEEQIRLASQFGFSDQPHLLAVEQFMQAYYRQTNGLHDRCMRFVDRMRGVSWWNSFACLWKTSLVEGCFRISGNRLTIPDDKLVKVFDSPEHVVRLFGLAQSRNLRIDSQIVDELNHHLESIPNESFHTPTVSRMFREILSGPGSIADTLECMHRARLLEKLIPAFTRVRGLMQFNQYHKYTVDEHSLLAVRQAVLLGREPGLLGRVYGEIRQKDLLHLALLLHDLGKGRPEDHSEAGKVIAQKTSHRLGLDQQEARTLEFLVYKHLLMAKTAFHRDLHDDKVILNFVREVKTPEVLKKFLIMTVADIAAVGPDVMNKWKEALLIELYTRTMAEVSGGRESTDGPGKLRKLAEEIEGLIVNPSRDPFEVQTSRSLQGLDIGWIEAQLAEFPNRYLSSTPVRRMCDHLATIRNLRPNEPIVEGYFNGELKICEYSLVTHEEVKPGIFMNVTGVLAAMGLQVLDAQIITRNDGIVLDTFSVSDPDYDGQPPASRLETVGRRIVEVLKGQESVDQVVKRSRRVTFGRPFPTGRHPTDVQIDNETSDHYTIIDVFADDKQGLLYVIGRTMFELGLSIHVARIGTRLDQVVDVFYVTGKTGSKVEDPGVCETIRQKIQSAVDEFLGT